MISCIYAAYVDGGVSRPHPWVETFEHKGDANRTPVPRSAAPNEVPGFIPTPGSWTSATLSRYILRVSSPSAAMIPPWGDWSPVDRATLVFVMRGDEVLLIRKLRGLGAGKINGPGGRVEPGETYLACAQREVEEELCVTPLGLQQRGELRFQFVDGHSIHGFVFTASGCDGEPQATEEAIPLWAHRESIPYAEMWADDRHWMPLLLAGKYFRGRFLFDGDQMLEQEIIVD